MIPRRICIESMLVVQSQAAHNGASLRGRGRRLGRTFPHPAHGSSPGTADPAVPVLTAALQARSGLPQSAQTGGEIVTAPARRSAISRSPTALGAGERPSVSSDGESSNA